MSDLPETVTTEASPPTLPQTPTPTPSLPEADATQDDVPAADDAEDIAVASEEALALPAAELDTVRMALEAALLSATEPLSVAELRRMFVPDIGHEVVQRLLAELQEKWAQGSVQLLRLASGWRFQTAPALQRHIERLRETRPPRYSRAVLETLAIIVYRQPVTRGDIEEIRGVAVSSQIIKVLENRGWIDAVGHRDTPGRPALYATTKKLLDDLGLRSLSELPPLSELEGVIDLVDTAQAQAAETAGDAEPASPDAEIPPGTPSAAEGGDGATDGPEGARPAAA
ncbi:MAG: SMC-Scp complex subunit ScpB [Moraxellaceae bacterium]|nr:SMC-Scp complex subunit ScpB [Moraxellaceae bacterium]